MPTESLRAELERLRAEQGALPGNSSSTPPPAQSLRAELESLRAEQGPLPETSLGSDIMTGVLSASRGIGENLGIPGTDIDMNAALEYAGARPMDQVRKDYEAAGPAAGVAKFGSEMLATAPVGGAIGGLVKGGMKFARAAKAGIEGAVAGGLTGEGNAVGDAAVGAVGGVIGDKVIRGVGRLGTGFENISDEAKKLLQNKMRITIGQAMPETFSGRAVRGIEDAASSIPFGIGDFVVAGKGAGIKDLKEKFVEAGLPSGMKAPASSKEQPLKALQEAGEEYSRRYGGILGKEGTSIKIDPDELVSISLEDPSAPLPEDSIKFIEKRLRKSVNIKNPTPQSLFDAQSTLRAEARELSSSASSTRLDRAESKIYRKAADEILNALEETNPGLKELGAPYRNYVTLLHEVEKGLGHGENLTLRQMQTAAKKSGNKELQDLTRSAGSILPSRTPDSGTPKRAAQLALAGGGAAALFDPSMLTASAVALGLIAPGALAKTQQGSKYLLGQYKGQENIRKLLEKYSATAGGMAAERASR